MPKPAKRKSKVMRTCCGKPGKSVFDRELPDYKRVVIFSLGNEHRSVCSLEINDFKKQLKNALDNKTPIITDYPVQMLQYSALSDEIKLEISDNASL